jgi:hypothetical protein
MTLVDPETPLQNHLKANFLAGLGKIWTQYWKKYLFLNITSSIIEKSTD